MKQNVHIDEIGIVSFNRTNKTKSIVLRVRPFQGVTVSFSPHIPFEKAKAFVISKKDWIATNKEKVTALEKKNIADETLPFFTRHHKVVFEQIDGTFIHLSVCNGEIKITYPRTITTSHPVVQKVIRKGLIEAYRIEAKNFLPQRVRELAQQFGFTYKNIAIKNIRSRWGSCSTENNINLSVHLMRLSDELIDYIILHELVHTQIKNHSKQFYDKLNEVCGDIDVMEKKMKEAGVVLY